MKKTYLVAAISSLVLAACATRGEEGGRGFAWVARSPANPQIWVERDAQEPRKGYVVIDQEPIYILQGPTNTIAWELPKDGPYYFPTDEKVHPGIEFVAAGGHPKLTVKGCTRGATRYQYVCTYDKAKKSKYMYRITVTSNDKDFIDSDPTVMNDDI